ncbi:MAG: hypothetical protein AAGC60_02525 [Acidobacteriota bacterium]
MSTARREPDRGPHTAPKSAPSRLLFALLAVFFLLRYDLWAQSDDSFLLGLPIAFTYHILYCLAAAVVLFLLVRHAWPSHLDAPESQAHLDTEDAAR